MSTKFEEDKQHAEHNIEQFRGFGVMGLPFASGHYLALRCFTESSVGPSYRAVWHLDPAVGWTVYANVPPEVSCARYLGAALSGAVTTPIELGWSGSDRLTVKIPGILDWTVNRSLDAATRMMSVAGSAMPDSVTSAPAILSPLQMVAEKVLNVGTIRLYGRTPNGQKFGMMPRKVWRIDESTATWKGRNLGPLGPLPKQAALADLFLPQRGIFVEKGTACFKNESPSPSK